ncbi:MAG: class I SAM-dependent methyltransferase [Anaerolineae bacterium]|nr:class I SAM-dependent methyltransferase [Anaerolineae bacterium]
MRIPIVQQIETLVQEIPGWSPLDQLYTLFNLAYLTIDTQGDFLEIGSWCGRSASVLGLAARLLGNTTVHCIDLFPEKKDWRQNTDGSYSFMVEIDGVTYGSYQEQTVWQEPFERDIAPLYENHSGIFDLFTQAIERSGMEAVVKAYRGDSEICKRLATLNIDCKLAFIDGDHSYAAVCRDIHNVERVLVKGGWICFDDAFSHYEGVSRAIEDCIIHNPHYGFCQQMTRKFFIAKRLQNS